LSKSQRFRLVQFRENRTSQESLRSLLNHARYDAFGKLAAMYNNFAAITPACTTCYLTTDYLGSVRMVTDPNANVVARHDYLPFGQEILAGQAAWNSQLGAPAAAQNYLPRPKKESPASR
jgi:hypothetical protein